MKLVSVVMPVYNAEAFVAEAIESILGQTLGDLELVIVDDGSTDRSVEVIQRHGDPRVRLLRNPRNLGVTPSLNRGLDAAEGLYVARMDADDVSLPDRLAKQVAFLEQHPDVGVCGAGVRAFGGQADWTGFSASTSDEIACSLLFNNGIAHPTVVLRGEVLRRFGLRYDPDYPHAEDYELWTRCAEVTRLHALREVVLRYRLHPASIGRCHTAAQVATTNRVRRRQLGRLGIEPSDAEMGVHINVAHRRFERDAVDAVERWLLRLAEANDRRRCFPEPTFARKLGAFWEEAGAGAMARGVCGWSRVLSSPLMDGLDLSPLQRARLSKKRLGASPGGGQR